MYLNLDKREASLLRSVLRDDGGRRAASLMGRLGEEDFRGNLTPDEQETAVRALVAYEGRNSHFTATAAQIRRTIRPERRAAA